MLYLAYGMNSNINEMSYRCPAAISLGRYDLSDHRLVFREVADAVYSPGDTLQTVLWDITPACESALDILEGYPFLYEKKYVKIHFMNFTTIAMLYYMIDDLQISHPSISYRRLLEEGYKQHGLNIDQIFQAEGFDLSNYAY